MSKDEIKDSIYYYINNKVTLFIVGIIFIVLLLTGNAFICSIFSAVFIILQSYVVLMCKARVGKEEHEEQLSLKAEHVSKNLFTLINLPIMIISQEGIILWNNDKAIEDLQIHNITGKNIKDIIMGFNVRYILEGKKTEFSNINFNNRNFDIKTSIIKEVICLTFIDITEKTYLANKVNEVKESVMLIEVDNLDDVIKTTEEDSRPQLIADIERTINNYGSSLNAMVKKYSSNKYVLVTMDKNIEDEMSRKFSILDTIRELSCGNKLAVTLSIGVGRGGSTPMENHDFATNAKELALGRGGDQCVVKSFEKVAFYGGKAKEVEKRTKVRARVIGHALIELINESSNIFIMGHSNPDMDCLGAAIGMYSVISSLDKECYIVLDEPHNAVDYMLDRFKKSGHYNNTFISTKKVKELRNDKSLLILVDVHNESYVLSPSIVETFDRLVVIDHHRKTKDFIQGALLSYVETYASSTSELVTELIQYMVEKPKLREEEAVALLSGICLDTKNFCFKTGVRTFEAAAFLRRLGADTVDVKKIFSENLDVYISKADVIRTATVKNEIAIAKCPPNISNLIVTAQAADELLNIKGISASFVISKYKDGTYISARSLGDINVQVIMEALGGGGHFNMAGTKIKEITLEETEQKLNEAIDNYLRKGEE